MRINAAQAIPFIKCTTDIDELEAQLEYPEDMLDSVMFTEAVWDCPTSSIGFP
jgi:hypothetical protein